MMDLNEFVLNLHEQEKAVNGMAQCTSDLLFCLQNGETADGEMLGSYMKICGYRMAYNALLQHAEILWQM